MDFHVHVAEEPMGGERRVPASKSLHQRALVLAACAGGPTRIEAGPSPVGDDVRRLAAALRTLGPWSGDALGASRERRTVDLGLGATGFRFTIAAATLRPEGARTLVTGHRRLLARPHVPLRRALTRLGGHVKRRSSGATRVRGGGVHGRHLDLRADVSSQYASALLLIAPRIGGLDLRLLQRPVSRPYLELTVDVLRAFGLRVETQGLDAPGGTLRVEAGVPAAPSGVYRVEADASCAAPWWAAAFLTGGEVRIADLPRTTRQADAALLGVLARMGAGIEDLPDGTVRVRGGGARVALGEVDLRDAPDLLPLVGALAADAPGTTRVTGAGHARFKESDRLATVAAAVRSLGGDAVVDGEDLVIRGRPLGGGVVDVAGDHRLALAFGVLGLRVPGVVLHGAEAVVKSYPTFLDELAGLAPSAPDRGPAPGEG